MDRKTQKYEIGAAIGFRGTFTDTAGATFTPAGATLKIKYKANGVLTTSTYSMVMNGSSATYSWDSSLADPGAVDWYAESTGSPKANNAGSFILVAGGANPNG